jgi:hypothetical protein
MLTPKVTEITRGSAHAEKAGQVKSAHADLVRTRALGLRHAGIALRDLAVSAPSVEVDLTTGPALRLIEGVRAQRLDAVVTSLPAPTQGLRVTSLGEQGAVAVLPATHPRAVDSAIALAFLRAIASTASSRAAQTSPAAVELVA